MLCLCVRLHLSLNSTSLLHGPFQLAVRYVCSELAVLRYACSGDLHSLTCIGTAMEIEPDSLAIPSCFVRHHQDCFAPVSYHAHWRCHVLLLLTNTNTTMLHLWQVTSVASLHSLS